MGLLRSKLSPVLRALRHRNYRLFFGGQSISMTGTWMQTVAQSWLVYRLTGSAALLGLVGFTSQFPVFLFAALGGTFADRRNPHRILITTQTLAMVLAFILAVLTLAGWVQVWHIFVLAGLLGIINAFDVPARQVLTAEIVGKEDLMNAIAMNSAMFNGSRIVGPAVAGILVAAVGEGWCFLANGVSYIAVIIGLLMMKIQFPASRPHHGSALANITEGFRFIGRTGPIRTLLILLAVVSVMGMPYSVLMPIFADKILHGGARGLGLLMGASGMGALLGALVLAARQEIRGLGNWVAYSCASFGASLILFSLSRSFWLSALLLLPVGFAMIVEMAASNTLIQAMVPDQLRGRVMSVYTMIVMGMSPLGALLAGVLAQHLMGAPATVALGGAVCILGAILFRVYLPSLRGEARRLIVAQQMAGGDPADEMTGSGLASNARLIVGAQFSKDQDE